MISRSRLWVAGVAGLLVAVAFLAGDRSSAADDAKDLIEGVQKVSAALEKNDLPGAKKLAEDLSKKIELEDLMHLYVLRTKKGLGVGAKPGAVTPDGLEKKLMALAKDPLPPKQLGDEAEALTRMGYDMAALAAIATAKSPVKDEGKKKKKDWISWSDELRDAALAMAAAAKSKKAPDLHKAATKADGACSKCHDVFRE